MKTGAKIAIGAVVAVIAIGAISSAGKSDDTPTVSQASSSNSSSSNSSSKNAAVATESKADEIPTATVGDTVTTKDLKITLTKAFTAKTIETSISGYDEKPDDGKIFLILEIEAENISDQKQNLSYLNFQSSIDDYSVDVDYLISAKPDGLSILSGDFMPGKKLTGYIAYQVSADWKELEAAYMDNIFDSKATFNLLVKSGEVKDL